MSACAPPPQTTDDLLAAIAGLDAQILALHAKSLALDAQLLSLSQARARLHLQLIQRVSPPSGTSLDQSIIVILQTAPTRLWTIPQIAAQLEAMGVPIPRKRLTNTLLDLRVTGQVCRPIRGRYQAKED